MRDIGIPRVQLEILLKASSLPHAVIVSGLRRVGKSTLLAQLAHQLGKDAFYYINFEDERFLSFQAEDANELFQSLGEIFGERKIFIIDEIQNIPDWERFVRRFMDLGYKFFITGSNASLLSRELGTRLTGRYVPVELFPFSYDEYLLFTSNEIPDISRLSTAKQASYQKLLDEYMLRGGLPEQLKYPELNLHQALYNDVLYRDIATRYQINEVRALKELASFLMSHPASLISYNKLKNQLRLGSVNTVKNYFDYMENSWLIFTLNVYDYSVKRQQVAPKKVYGIDTGLLNSVGFSFSPNTGRMLENLVFLALRRKTNEIYYYTSAEGHEVDFYLPKQGSLYQVSQDLHQPNTYEREVRSLLEAMKALKVSSGTILTKVSGEVVKEDGYEIQITRVLDWLLSGAR
jgi:predicted AAA+ superfamily ATPase